jgi:hypothetical protein
MVHPTMLGPVLHFFEVLQAASRREKAAGREG